MSNRLIILSGPSCVGKSPLDRAMKTFYPELKEKLTTLVLYNSREARPGEKDGIDYYFRTRSFIESLQTEDHMVVMEVRGDLQAIDLKELSHNLASTDVFFEGNPFIGSLLLTHERLENIEKLSVFMSPLSREEILFYKNAEWNVSLPDLVTDIMRRKLLRRTRKQKTELSLKDYENIEKRASSAYSELQKAYLFDHVIVNHDGEDSENWEAFYYPMGDARKSLEAFIELLTGEQSAFPEKWDEELLD
jgi:guanylate kinase